jgi:hypothetical protein
MIPIELIKQSILAVRTTIHINIGNGAPFTPGKTHPLQGKRKRPMEVIR